MKAMISMMLVLAVAGVAMAAPGGHTSKPWGPLEMSIDEAGVGIVTNTGTTPFAIDAYSLTGKNGFTFDRNAWNTIGEIATAKFMADGAGYAAWEAAHVQPYAPMVLFAAFEDLSGGTDPAVLNQASLARQFVFAPGESIDFGAAFLGGDQSKICFEYSYIDAQMNAFNYEGRIVPEPATMSLLGLGALALIRRRR